MHVRRETLRTRPQDPSTCVQLDQNTEECLGALGMVDFIYWTDAGAGLYVTPPTEHFSIDHLRDT